VKHYPGADFKAFPAKAGAEAYLGTDAAGPAVQCEAPLAASCATPRAWSGGPLAGTIYVDGGHSSHTGEDAWGRVVDWRGVDLVAAWREEACVDLETRDVVLPGGPAVVLVARFADVRAQQNNGAELIAMVFGLRVAALDSRVREICSDSELMVSWWSRRLGAKRRDEMDPRKVALIDELIASRRAFEARGGRIVKIPGGANLADLGWHR
jgi:ribonuclease HI